MDHSYYFDTLKGHSGSVNSLYLCSKVSNSHEFYNGDRFSSGILVSGSEDKTILLWDLKTNKYEIDEINMHD